MLLRSVSWTLLAMGSLFTMMETEANPTKFVILITSYNNEKFAEDNLRSACFQKSTYPYRIIYVNDASTDRTKEIVENFRTEQNLSHVLTVINNATNMSGIMNYYNVIHGYIDDEEIVVNLDGDDILEDNVLLTLERYYSNPDVWLTYGSARFYPGGELIRNMSSEYPEHIIKEMKFREYDFFAQHLRTFKAWLFKRLNKDDFYYNGLPITGAPDMAFMIPMLEMCCPYGEGGINHSTFVPEVLYNYRTTNPLSQHILNLQRQKNEDDFIRSKKPYQPICR